MLNFGSRLASRLGTRGKASKFRPSVSLLSFGRPAGNGLLGGRDSLGTAPGAVPRARIVGENGRNIK